MKRYEIKRLEKRSLLCGIVANLAMGALGIVFAILSNSTAILLDGLFSLIGFGSAWLARRIVDRIDAGPDRLRPYGYAADEAMFTTFRALSLLGLILFAAVSAMLSIYAYASGEPIPSVEFGPAFVYFIVISAICLGLWLIHWRSWVATGRRSQILRLEAKSCLFDGVLTIATGAGLAAVYVFGDGFLAPVAPIGDSLVVLALCLVVVGQYGRDLASSMGELAGVTARPAIVGQVRRALRPALKADGGKMIDMSVMKLGRDHFVAVYYDPLRPISAEDVDTLNLRMIRDVSAEIENTDVFVYVTRYARRWPDHIDPRA